MSEQPHGNDTPKKAADEILDAEVDEGLDALRREAVPLFISALSAGLDVGFSVLLMGVVWTQTHGHLPPPVVNMLVAASYVVGFVFVIIGRSELFTEQTTLAVLPVLRGKATIAQLTRLWAIVLFGNMVGAIAFGAVLSVVTPRMGIIDPAAFDEIATKLIRHGVLEMIVSAILAGWLMGLLSWVVAAGRDTMSQLALISLITFVIGLATLGHVVAGAVEVAAALRGDQVSITDLLRFLSLTAFGNAIGGSVFVALIKNGHSNWVRPRR